MKDKLIKSKYSEWQASLWGATVASFGVGIIFADYFKSIAPFLILLGIILHGWGMYQINKRNKGG